MIALALALVTTCPVGVLAEVCALHDACVVEAFRERPPTEGVTEREAALVARYDAERACALAGWSLAVRRAAAVAVATSTAPVCPPCLTAAPVSAACDDRPVLVDVLSHGGACALCGGAIALGAWAGCGGGP